jgi:hypothetical protein
VRAESAERIARRRPAMTSSGAQFTNACNFSSKKKKQTHAILGRCLDSPKSKYGIFRTFNSRQIKPPHPVFLSV